MFMPIALELLCCNQGRLVLTMRGHGHRVYSIKNAANRDLPREVPMLHRKVTAFFDLLSFKYEDVRSRRN